METDNRHRLTLPRESLEVDEEVADKKHHPLEFRTGDQVLIKLRPKQIRFRGCKDQRLFRKYKGPVEVLKRMGNTSYKLVLPTWMKIHRVIHVSNLKP
ncbi:reverse transcriptase [Cucumis melo var. makuwa]|uniref:Reverse transcriptase n=1 Tax=Cucumis melo var. makuwa TaxID=1194695 RepID=A0A5A7SXX3_CUCMM|nr:reverse transcriptase [Cucumis melo var. makuwa]